MSAAPKIIRMDGTPESEEDRLAALEARVSALEAAVGKSEPPAKPEPAPRHVRKPESALPQSEQAKAVAGIFHRKLTTAWSPKEIAAFKALGPLDMADLLTIANYYESERAKGCRDDGTPLGIHRHDLGTFLNNYRGELDRATVWGMRHPGAARRPLSNGTAPKTAEVEPEGFRAWLLSQYPTVDPKVKYEAVPKDIRARFKPNQKP